MKEKIIRFVLVAVLIIIAFGVDGFLWLLKKLKKICIFPGG